MYNFKMNRFAFSNKNYKKLDTQWNITFWKNLKNFDLI